MKKKKKKKKKKLKLFLKMDAMVAILKIYFDFLHFNLSWKANWHKTG